MLASFLLGVMMSPALAGELQFVHSVHASDVGGEPVSGPHAITVSLLDAGDAVVWTDTFVDVPLVDGHASVTLQVDADGDTLEQALFGPSPAVAVRTALPGLGLPAMVEPLALGTVPVAARAIGVQVASDVAGDNCPHTGALAFDDQAKLLVVCTAGAWVLVQ